MLGSFLNFVNKCRCVKVLFVLISAVFLNGYQIEVEGQI